MNNTKQRISINGFDGGHSTIGMRIKPVLTFKDMDIYHYAHISKKLVRLTKWLQPVPTELKYLHAEYHRIKNDLSRICVAVVANNMIALFVNDLTNGAFDDEDDDN